MSVTSKFLLDGETYEYGLRRALRCWKNHDETHQRRIAELQAENQDLRDELQHHYGSSYCSCEPWEVK